MNWNRFKQLYPEGTHLKIAVYKKSAPAFINFKFTEEIKGSIHISDLNWNYGLCQQDFYAIDATQELDVYIKEFNDQSKRVQLGRKLLIDRPSSTPQWEAIELNVAHKVVVVEQFINKILILFENGIYGTLPIYKTNVIKNQELNQVVPIFKNEKDEVIECSLSEILLEVKEKERIITDVYNSKPVESAYSAARDILSDFELFSTSVYWKQLKTEEQDVLEKSFKSDRQLFSKANAGPEPIYVEFPFDGSAFHEFKQQVIPLLLEKDEDVSSDSNEYYLNLLSQESFWYCQYYYEGINSSNEKFNSRKFTLFNDRLSISGSIFLESKLRIGSIKSSEIKGSLFERARSLKQHQFFLLKRPVIFYGAYSNMPHDSYNKTFIERIENKIQANNIFDRSMSATLGILREQGKDFDIFQEYLKNQIATETKQAGNTETELIDCRLSQNLQTDFTEFIGLTSADHPFVIDDKVIITAKSNEIKSNFYTKGVVNMIRGREISIFIPLIDFEILKNGCYIKRIFSTRQHEVQLKVLDDFFENKLSLDAFYQVFYDRENILPPSDVRLNFYNKRLEDNFNPQNVAVRKAVGNSNILLIQGPPGTGKTTVITEVVKQLIKKKERILVTSQTHVAVDNVLERIIEEKGIRIARLGQSEMISSFAKPYLLEQTRKDFEQEILELADFKIGILYERIYGKDMEELRMMANQNLDWKQSQIFEFLESIKLFDKKTLESAITSLENWKNVISTSSGFHDELFTRNLDVVFGTCIGIATNRLFSKNEIMFDTVILDEAGKANISETLTAISKARKVILVGDHKQLPPFIDSESVKDFTENSRRFKKQVFTEDEVKKAIGGSFFEYLQIDGILPSENKCMLAVQHRMHPDIGNFVSESFYESKLENGAATPGNILPIPPPYDKQIIFIDTSTDSAPYEDFYEGSYLNRLEAKFIVDNIVPGLLASQVRVEDMAVVSPYSLQCREIKKALNEKAGGDFQNLEVATLDSFQGKEYDVIIFSFTRSAKAKRVGFLDDARRLNVAFSRAKKKLIMIGNAETLVSIQSHADRYYANLFSRLVRHSKKYGSFLRSNELNSSALSKIGVSKTNGIERTRVRELKKGQKIIGEVVAIENSGIKISFDDRIWVISNSEIKPSGIKEMQMEFAIGEKIDVWIKDIGRNNIVLTTINLGSRIQTKARHLNVGQFAKTELKKFEEKYKPGSEVMGEITKIRVIESGGNKVYLRLAENVLAVLYINIPPPVGTKIKVCITKVDHVKQIIKCVRKNERI